MPQNINQPSNRINLTNVSVVRYRKRKTRFELACYKNKLLEYRSGTETCLDNILQVPTIFVNVSKGMSAPNAELQKAFGKEFDKEAVIKEILSKGEVQVGAGERREEKDRLEREVLDLVVGRLVEPSTKRVYTVGIIKKALDQLSQQGGRMGRTHDAPGSGDARANSAAGMSAEMAQMKLNGNGAGTENTRHGADREGKEEEDDEDDDTDSTDTRITSTSTPQTKNATSTAATPNTESRKPDLPIWTGVVTTKSAKIQALDAMKALIAWQPIPVMRARMRLRISCPNSVAKQVVTAPTATITTSREQDGKEGIENKRRKGKSQQQRQAESKQHRGSGRAARYEAQGEEADNNDNEEEEEERKGKGEGGGSQTKRTTTRDHILSYIEQVEAQDVLGGGGDPLWEVIGFVEPGAFKGLAEFVSSQTRGKGRCEVLDLGVTHED